MLLRTIIVIAITATALDASAAEICGNGIDDDLNNLVDEGCYPGLVTQCENPLSCEDTGYVAPKVGGLHYSLPPDVAPSSPFGVPLSFRRFYMSKFEPGGAAPAYRKALGEHWGHSYATWLDRNTVPNPDQIVVHLPRGQDVMFEYANPSPDGLWEEFKIKQPGHHYQWLRRRLASPNDYQLKTLTGEILVYNSGGRLTELWDSLATPNKTLLVYSGGQLETVTDATGKRRLQFLYTSNQLTTVRFQVFTTSWLNKHTTTYSYTSGNLTGVTIGGQAAQTNLYTSNFLTSIQDANGNTLVNFAYDSATAGKVVRVDTPRGVVGWEFASSRSNCSGQTVLYFHRANTTSCNTDTDCGTGHLCGGKTGAGSTGQCFRGARCLTVASPSEDVITTVSSFAGNSEQCDGACLDAIAHVWDTTAGKLDLLAEKAPADPSSYYTVQAFNANGLPLQISYGATAADGTGAQRKMFFSYDSTFPGRIATTYRKSDFPGDACDPLISGSCVTSTSISRIRSRLFISARFFFASCIFFNIDSIRS